MEKYALCLMALLATAAFAQRSTGPPASPLPLDPLTPREIERATQVAQADPRVREMLGANARLVYVLSIAPKQASKDGEPAGRHAEVLFIRADNEYGVHVLVDLAARRAMEQVRVAPASVPLGRADVEEALRIASESPELRQLVGARAGGFRVLRGPITRELANSDYVQGLRHIGGEGDPCAQHRCVYLLFNSGGQQILTDQEIVVDLNARQARVSSVREGGRS